MASLSLAGAGGARADGESAVDAGSGRQQSLLEHRRQQLEGLRERIGALDATATRAVARAAALESELEASRERLQAADARAAALEDARDGQRERADAAADAVAALESGLAGQSERLEALEAARARTLATLERNGLDEASLDETLGAFRTLEASHEALRARLAEGEARAASLEETLTAERAASEARVVELERALAAARADESGRGAGVAGAASETETGDDVGVGSGAGTGPSAGDLVLSERWYVPLENGAPRDYVGPGALGSAAELPPATACETFAGGAAADGAALAKLEINGFPVTAFWVRREDGRPGICRLVPRTSGAFDARLSSLAVLRSERAIVVTRRGE